LLYPPHTAVNFGLAISFAVATFAQQPNTPDPKLREALATLLKKWTMDSSTAMPLPAGFYTPIGQRFFVHVPNVYATRFVHARTAYPSAQSRA
jgi:hypothetical protein